MTNTDYQSLEKQHHFQLYRRFPVTLVQGKGCSVWDTEGNEYLDALAGVAVNALGHCHPNVVKAIQDQAEKLIHVSNFYHHPPLSKLAQKLCQLSGLDRAFFCNSGAESMEAAIKLARQYAYQKGKQGPVVAMENCFHGRTIATVAMGKQQYQEGFGPMPEGFTSIPLNDKEALQYAAGKNPIAIVIEPVQGEGGIHVAEKTYLKEARRICDEKDILLILDEIQCGIGRTGSMFAFEHSEVQPDIMTLAKALGGGMPIGAMLAKEQVAKVMAYGSHGTTYGGNPVACASSLAVLETIEKEQLIKAAEEKGQYIFDRLYEIGKGWDAIRELRGKGLMIGVDLNFEAKPVVDKMFQKGVLGNVTAQTTLRLVPPLIISHEEIDRVLKIMVEAIKETEAENPERKE